MRAGVLLVVAVAALAVACDRPRGSRDPEAAVIHTSDVGRFWAAVDAAGDRPLRDFVRTLQRVYINDGSLALRAFLRDQGLTALDLGRAYQDDPARYQAIRSTSLAAGSLEPEIRALFHRLQALYPEAVFPDVHFVVGAGGPGGQGSFMGLTIAAEMATEPQDYLLLVAHELAHAQQRRGADSDLLTRALREGAADFAAELLTGRPILSRAYAWGAVHETDLWARFQQEMGLAETYGTWVSPRAGSGMEPGGLGYFLGYRVARSFWERGGGSPAVTGSPPHLLKELLRWDDSWTFLAASGYAPGELSRFMAGTRRALTTEAAPSPRPGQWVRGLAATADVPSHGAPPAPELRSVLGGYELHDLALFPEHRLYGPALRGPAAWSPGSEVEAKEALAVTWRTRGRDSLTLYYDGADSLPLGAKLHFTDPEVDLLLDDWRAHPSGLLLFHGATLIQGEAMTRYHFARVELEGGPS